MIKSKKQIQIVSLILLLIMALQILVPGLVNATSINDNTSQESEAELKPGTESEAELKPGTEVEVKIETETDERNEPINLKELDISYGKFSIDSMVYVGNDLIEDSDVNSNIVEIAEDDIVIKYEFTFSAIHEDEIYSDIPKNIFKFIEGDYYDIGISENIKKVFGDEINNIEGNITSKSITVGTFKYSNENNSIRLLFGGSDNNFKEWNDEIKKEGKFQLSFMKNINNITEEIKIPYSFEKDKVFEIKKKVVEEGLLKHLGISKDAKKIDHDTYEWTIEIKNNGDEINNIFFVKDELPEYLKFGEDAKISPNDQEISYSISKDKKSMDINFNKGLSGSAEIKVLTKIDFKEYLGSNEIKDWKIKNDLILLNSNKDIINKEEIYIDNKHSIFKVPGEIKDDNGETYINWTIYAKRPGNMTDIKIVDTLGEGLEGIELITENWKVESSDNKIYTLSPKNNLTDDLIFIEYKTKIVEQKDRYINTVEFGKDTFEAAISESWKGKYITNIEYTDSGKILLDWKINYYIGNKNIEILDTINNIKNIKHNYVKNNDVKVSINDNEDKTVKVDITENKMEIKIDKSKLNKARNKISVDYKTELNFEGMKSEEIDAVINSFRNDNINDLRINGDEFVVKLDRQMNINYVNNLVKWGKLKDDKSRIINWEIKANHQARDLAKVVLQDKFADQKLNKDSLKIYLGELDTIGNIKKIEDTSDIKDEIANIIILEEQSGFRITFKEDIEEKYKNKPIVIEYETVATGLSKETYSNEVLFNNKTYKPVIIGYPKWDKYILKSIEDKAEVGASINWNIKINEGLSIIEDFILKDEVNENLGRPTNFVVKNLISGTIETDKFDIIYLGDGKNGFEMKTINNEPLEGYYELRYETLILGDIDQKISNAAFLSGVNVENASSKLEDISIVASGDASSESIYSFDIKKSALYDDTIKLDAKFSLLKKLNETDYKSIIEFETENGEFKIRNIKEGKYFLKELKAPKGYKVLDELIEINIGGEEDNNEKKLNLFNLQQLGNKYTLTIYNEKIKENPTTPGTGGETPGTDGPEDNDNFIPSRPWRPEDNPKDKEKIEKPKTEVKEEELLALAEERLKAEQERQRQEQLKQNAKKLPKTGSKSNIIFTVVGISFIALSAALRFKKED